MRRHHDDLRAVRPSDTAVRRLREQLRRDVADLRVRLEEVSLRSEVHERIGNLDGVEAALVEQRQMLVQFERRVQHRIVDSIVEREAEAVLGGAVQALRDVGTDIGAFAPDVVVTRPGPAQRVVRTLAAAAAAVLATMLMLSSGMTPIDPAAVPSDDPQAAPDPSSEPSDDVSAAGDTGGSTSIVAGRPTWQEPASGVPTRPSSDAQDGDDPSKFFEQLLHRIFGAVASVGSSARASLPAGLEATEIASAELADDLLELVPDEQVELVNDGGSGDDATADDDIATDDDRATDEQEAGGATDTEDEPAEQSSAADDEASEGDSAGGSGLGWTSQGGSTGFGSGLPGWS